jgi:hypothetical protein
MVTQWVITALRCRRTRWLHLQYFTCNICLHNAFHWLVKKRVIHQPWPSLTTPPNFRQSLPKIKWFEMSATMARSFVRCRRRAWYTSSFFLATAMQRFYPIALPSPEKYCPCIRSLKRIKPGQTDSLYILEPPPPPPLLLPPCSRILGKTTCEQVETEHMDSMAASLY